MIRHPFIDFQGKYVIITGATSGIGRAIATELSRQGARPILVGRNAEKLKETASSLETPGGENLCLDLNDYASILPKVKELSQRIGRIYGLCHSAGIVDTVPLSSCSAEKIKAMMGVNLVAGIEMARAVCRRDILEEECGSILFIASIYGLIGMAGEVGYSASKGAILAAARTMAIELARRKVRVNTVSPGFVKSRMTDTAFSLLSEEHRKNLEADHPLGIGYPEDVAKAAVFLLAPQNKWITGINLVIDGGYTAR